MEICIYDETIYCTEDCGACNLCQQTFAKINKECIQCECNPNKRGKNMTDTKMRIERMHNRKPEEREKSHWDKCSTCYSVMKDLWDTDEMFCTGCISETYKNERSNTRRKNEDLKEYDSIPVGGGFSKLVEKESIGDEISESIMDEVVKNIDKKIIKDDELKYLASNFTETQQKISDICDSLKEFLIEKNRRYGNSALDPARIFSKANTDEQLKVRLDDKINRIMNSDELRTNDMVDFMGYLVLILVHMNIIDFSHLID